MVFFQEDESLIHKGGHGSVEIEISQDTEAQVLPNPSDDGFDIPIV